LLMDITSIKSAPVDAMLGATRASVVGTHPCSVPACIRCRASAW
jgi:prephenate dehydrogenase